MHAFMYEHRLNMSNTTPRLDRVNKKFYFDPKVKGRYLHIPFTQVKQMKGELLVGSVAWDSSAARKVLVEQHCNQPKYAHLLTTSH